MNVPGGSVQIALRSRVEKFLYDMTGPLVPLGVGPLLKIMMRGRRRVLQRVQGKRKVHQSHIAIPSIKRVLCEFEVRDNPCVGERSRVIAWHRGGPFRRLRIPERIVTRHGLEDFNGPARRPQRPADVGIVIGPAPIVPVEQSTRHGMYKGRGGILVKSAVDELLPTIDKTDVVLAQDAAQYAPSDILMNVERPSGGVGIL